MRYIVVAASTGEGWYGMEQLRISSLVGMMSLISRFGSSLCFLVFQTSFLRVSHVFFAHDYVIFTLRFRSSVCVMAMKL